MRLSSGFKVWAVLMLLYSLGAGLSIGGVAWRWATGSNDDVAALILYGVGLLINAAGAVWLIVVGPSRFDRS